MNSSTGRSLRQTMTRTAGIACVVSSAVLVMATSFISPGANAADATNVVVQSWRVDGLGKRDAFGEQDMLIQDEALLNDGTTWSDADPLAAITTPIDETPLKPTYVKRFDVRQAGIPTYAEGDTAKFRVRVYPRYLNPSTGYLSSSEITVRTTTDNPETPAADCDITSPATVEAEGNLVYECTVPNVKSRGVNTLEDLIHTISVTRIATDDPARTPLTLTESATINVVRPCITVKKEVRALGSSDPWDDANTAEIATRIEMGGTAEYRVTATNCGETTLENVQFTDTISGCNFNFTGTLAVGSATSYSTTENQTCRSNDVTQLVSSTVTVRATASIAGRNVPVTAADPVNVAPRIVETTTTQPVTTQPVTTQPVTTQPVTTQPVTTQPVTTQPVTTQPVTTQPVTTQPVTTQPVTTQPVTTQPVTTQPVTTQPVTTQPVTTQPVTTQPVTTQPVTTQPVTTQPVTTQPVTTQPVTTQPVTTQPVTTQPVTTRPTTTVAEGTPSICIKKFVRQAGTTGEWLDAQDVQNAAFITNSTTADYRIEVRNCGATPVVNVSVTDNNIAGCARTIGNLAIGQTFTYETATTGSENCKSTNVVATTCSTATVTANPVIGGTVTNTTIQRSDPVCVTTSPVVIFVPPVTVAPAPCVAIKKYVRQAGLNGAWLDAQDAAGAALITSGADAEYEIVVSNCGNTGLIDLQVTDPISGCAKNIPTLGLDANVIYGTTTVGNEGCKSVKVTEGVCNTATVTAQMALNGAAVGNRISANDAACIKLQAPAASAVTPSTPSVAPTTMRVTVLNTSVAEPVETTEELGVTGTTPKPMLFGAAALFMMGLALVNNSRRQPVGRHARPTAR